MKLRSSLLALGNLFLYSFFILSAHADVRIVPGRAIVFRIDELDVLNASFDAPDELIEQSANDAGMHITNRVGTAFFLNTQAPLGTMQADAFENGIPFSSSSNPCAAINNLPEGYACEPDFLVEATDFPITAPNDFYYQSAIEPNFGLIRVPQAWLRSLGASVVVAVIDTGVKYTHPDLQSNMWTNSVEMAGTDGVDDDGNGLVDDKYGYDFVNNDGDPMDDHYHGTHVAGTIAAIGNNSIGVIGVAPQAKIMALKFLSASGSGSTSGAIFSLNYAVQMGAKISNNSWGGGGFSNTLNTAITSANTAGHVFIAAAGNSGTNNDTSPFYPANYPISNVISVAATNSAGTKASFSNYGATTVHVGAPGVTIYSTYTSPDYQYLNGTSMAAPHVSGVVALLRSLDSSLTGSQIRSTLISTKRAISDLTGLTVAGGVVDADAALQSISATPTPTSTPTQTNTPLLTNTPTITNTPTQTPTSAPPTFTPTATPTSSNPGFSNPAPMPTSTGTPTPTATEEPEDPEEPDPEPRTMKMTVTRKSTASLTFRTTISEGLPAYVRFAVDGKRCPKTHEIDTEEISFLTTITARSAKVISGNLFDEEGPIDAANVIVPRGLKVTTAKFKQICNKLSTAFETESQRR